MIDRVLLDRVKRSSYTLWAFVLFVALSIPAIHVARTHAYGLLSTRYIKMSNSSLGGQPAGQNVAYEVGFTTATDNITIGSITIDFCVNSPIIGATCTAPTGFDTHYDTLALDTTGSSITDFTINGSTISSANRLLFSRPSATPVAANTAIILTLGNGTSNGITNPTDLDDTVTGIQQGTFFARIQTWTNTDGTGTNDDAGGVALACTVSLDITSKVQERLRFCVYRDISCNAATQTGTILPNNAFNLGNAQGVLDSVGPFVDNKTQYDVATNASGGVSVRLKGDTLKTGSFSINAIGATPLASATGTEQFGLCTYNKTAGPKPILPETKYGGGNLCNTTSNTSGSASSGGAGSALFAFDTNTTNGTMSTYGEVIAKKEAGPEATGVLVFIGNVADTTEAGIYTTQLNLIATGTY